MSIAVKEGGDFSAVIDEFQDTYHGRYGHSSPGAGIELVALRSTAGRPFDQRAGTWGDPNQGVAVGSQTVYFDGEPVLASVFLREDVVELSGPALILESTSTTVVPPGWVAKRVPAGHLLLERTDAS